jgi:hypothetical protein
MAEGKIGNTFPSFKPSRNEILLIQIQISTSHNFYT